MKKYTYEVTPGGDRYTRPIDNKLHPRCFLCYREIEFGEWVYWCELKTDIHCEDKNCKKNMTPHGFIEEHTDYYCILKIAR